MKVFRKILFRANWRLAIATLGFLASEYDLAFLPNEQRIALRATSFATIIATIASWQTRIGKKVARPPRPEDESHEP